MTGTRELGLDNNDNADLSNTTHLGGMCGSQ